MGTFSGNQHYNDIPANREYVRMPRANKVLALDEGTTYIGSPLGGPILIWSSGIGGETVELDINPPGEN